MNFETARTQMLGQQVRAWDVLDSRVLAVMGATPRELFVPEADRELAFADIEIPLAHGQSMMAPKVEGRLLQALRLDPDDSVLEIGTGTGFLTACLARLTRRVTSLDIFPDFVAGAKEKLHAQGIRNVDLATADALSIEGSDTFDAIAVTGSMPRLDDRFIGMLTPGGRLFVVVGRPPVMEALLVTRHEGGHWARQDLFETLLTPLVNSEQAEPFVL